MATKAFMSQSSDSFEYMLFEGDPDHLKSVVCTPNQINPWIEPSVLKLRHRIGRGPFGDVWLATHHHCTEDYDRYHEVAVKMIYPIKDDQMQNFIAMFAEIFSKCQGLKNVCLLHGVSVQNGRACIVMKFYEGSVGDKMARLKGGRLSLSDVLRYGADLARGILELHSKGILVLNLKPGNALLNEHDQAILGDFGIPWLLYGLPLPSSDMVQRLGTPNYMAPEQWQPNVRGPISFETDSWGFGCNILETLTGNQPWDGKSHNEIFNLVVTKQEKPNIPSGLPRELEDVLWGCFQYDFRSRPLMRDILQAFKSCRNAVVSSDDCGWIYTGKHSTCSIFTDWSLLRDHLQVGDTVRSRKPKNSYRPESMVIPEGTVVGISTDIEAKSFILVKIHGFHNPLKVLSSTVERVTHGFASGDWVKVGNEDNEHRSPVGTLHNIERDGKVAVGFIGMETLWNGSYTELQMAESYRVGQFTRLKPNVSSPRFEWPRNGGGWATGRVSQILPNGCLVVKFPGRFSFGETLVALADPSEVEVVSFATCEGVVKKYHHIEDFHWGVRPLMVALGLFSALRLGFFAGKNAGKSRRKKAGGGVPLTKEKGQNQDGQNVSNSQWLPPSIANIIFKEGGVGPAR